MYTKEELVQYPYFAEKIEEAGLNGLLDQLTGLISRGHILWFAQWLIEQKIPFSFAMLDLDNFKFINDTYGHHVGDQVLVHVADDLAAYLAGFGLAGRFGGDEFLIITSNRDQSTVVEGTLSEMLPNSFGPKDLI